MLNCGVNLYLKHFSTRRIYLTQMLTKIVVLFCFSFLQTCDIKQEEGKRFLTLHKVKLDQAGEVLYQAMNAVTTAILTVKGKGLLELVEWAQLFTHPENPSIFMK